MEINKEINLGNKVKVNYTIIYSIEVVMNEYINIILHSFTSEDYYKKALEKKKLQKEQEILIQKINETLDENEALIYHNQINELANKIEKLHNYEDYIVGINNVKIPFVEDYNENYLKEEILKRL